MIHANPLDFTSKAVLVTGGGAGAGAGIGRGIAEPEGIGNGLEIPGA